MDRRVGGASVNGGLRARPGKARLTPLERIIHVLGVEDVVQAKVAVSEGCQSPGFRDLIKIWTSLITE